MNIKDTVLYSSTGSQILAAATFITAIVCISVLVVMYIVVSAAGRLIERMIKVCALLVWKSINLLIASKCKRLNMSKEEINDVVSDINQLLYSSYTHIINNPTDIVDKNWFGEVEFRLDEIITYINQYNHKK